jgi:hypothetical protein
VCALRSVSDLLCCGECARSGVWRRLDALSPTCNPAAKAQQRRWIAEVVAANPVPTVLFLLDDWSDGSRRTLRPRAPCVPHTQRRRQTEELLALPQALRPHAVFTANYKPAVVHRLHELGVEHAYLACACLGLEGSAEAVQKLGGLNVVFVDRARPFVCKPSGTGRG